ncbi:MAG: phosphodiesterase [Rhodospirillaceae bacterium]|nr:phosphodiesterase [Rhodospirillaceae bacterium]
MIIAQISDLHLRTDGQLLKGKVDSVAALDAVIAHLNALSPRPDLVLATGDLVNKAHRQDVDGLRRALDRLAMPHYVIVGNHDDRDMIRDTFADLGYLPPKQDKFLHYVLEDHPLRLIGLDTKRDDHDGGEMCEARRQWLDDRLSEASGKPTLIFMHHPPFATGIGFMDKHGFVGGTELEAVVGKHRQVEMVICGHLHRDITKRWAGTVARVAPSVVFQMAMDFTEGVESGFVLEPTACPIYLWGEDTGVIAHRSQVGDFGPKHPFVIDPL